MNYLRLIVSLVLPLAAGIVGSVFTVSSADSWYALLIKPAFTPPDSLFGPVWTILYLMMGVSVYLIWSAYANASADKQKIGKNKEAKEAFWLFWIHLLFNASWSVIFFGLQNIGLALINIMLLWIFILALIIKYWKIERQAAWLLLPYIIWVTFATALNYSLLVLN